MKQLKNFIMEYLAGEIPSGLAACLELSPEETAQAYEFRRLEDYEIVEELQEDDDIKEFLRDWVLYENSSYDYITTPDGAEEYFEELKGREAYNAINNSNYNEFDDYVIFNAYGGFDTLDIDEYMTEYFEYHQSDLNLAIENYFDKFRALSWQMFYELTEAFNDIEQGNASHTIFEGLQ